ncbi:HpcH/HpaI aldolase family protein [Halovivax limisalsi]|uniref:HpcH/HpaI aldolase family protein n=1 Tax=Halovivax limisalsi TaxID=1453760 RepID=UPI001FFDDBC7|nr:aldolase/citrate lyase family protein [Halovivax limisalsi]
MAFDSRPRSRVLDALDGEEPVFGATVLTASPAMIEALASVELDYVWVDLEHAGPSPYDTEAIASLARAAEVADVDLLIRVPEASRTMINSVVDAGADVVLVPKVDSAEEARRAVRAARFEHDGEPGDRGAPLTRSSGWTTADADLPSRADRSVGVGVMLETAAAVDAASEILAVPGVAFGFVGPGDLSISAGRPLESDHPDVGPQLDRLERAAADVDAALGRIATDPAEIATAIGSGYRVFRIGVDTVAVASTVTDRLAEARSRF